MHWPLSLSQLLKGTSCLLVSPHSPLPLSSPGMSSYRLAAHPPLGESAGIPPNKVATGSTSSSSIALGLTHSMAALTAADLAAPPSARWYRRERSSGPAANLSAADRAQLIGTGSVKGFAAELVDALTSSKAAASSGLRHMVVEPLQHAGFISVSVVGEVGLVHAALDCGLATCIVTYQYAVAPSPMRQPLMVFASLFANVLTKSGSC